ncbi:MAG: amidohydrolase family protein [Thermoplasmatota archaeon]
MTSHLLRGQILYPDGWSEGAILIEEGRIMDVSGSVGSDLSGDVVHEGLILPGLMDMHTHLGDHGARGFLPTSLEKTVLPGGIKHRYLSSATREEKISSIRASIEEVHPAVTMILDYREGGAEGLELLSEAARGGGPMVCPLARIEEGDDPYFVLEQSCGIGQPSLKDGLQDLRRLTKERGKVFSIHASELFREDIDTLIELYPDHIVHMISGTVDDWTTVSDARIPVTVCPRSNLAYGLEPPIAEMMDRGVMLTLGTDNAISSKQDMFRDMEAAWLLLRKKGIEGSQAARKVFEMATGMSMKGADIWGLLPRWTKWWEPEWPRKGDPAHLFILDRPAGSLWKTDPYSQLVRFTGRSQVSFTPDLDRTLQ